MPCTPHIYVTARDYHPEKNFLACPDMNIYIVGNTEKYQAKNPIASRGDRSNNPQTSASLAPIKLLTLVVKLR
jgi:hypothetical protein